MKQILSSIGCVVLLSVGCSAAPNDVAGDEGSNELGSVSNAVVVPVDGTKELVITDLSVVEDPVRTVWSAGATTTSSAGAWSFGGLMARLANTNDPQKLSDFTLSFLQKWNAGQAINGFVAAARPAMQTTIIDPWLAKSGGQRLDMQFAPFRLLAITNRLDLRGTNQQKGDPNFNAGEGRFVFGILDGVGNKLPGTVIFEFGLSSKFDSKAKAPKGEPLEDGKGIQDWAKGWHALGPLAFGTKYNDALEKLTATFSGPTCPWKSNASCLHQLRTNEVPLAATGTDPVTGGKLWELREFQVDASGQLAEVTTKQAPDASFNGSSQLASLINANASTIVAGDFVVPPAMLAASNPAPTGGFWNAPGILDNEARFHFSVNTCNGCHTSETGTKFLHVKTRLAGQQSLLSGFLTGRTDPDANGVTQPFTAPDPVTGAPRSFGDIDRRAADMAAVLIADPKSLEAPGKKGKPD